MADDMVPISLEEALKDFVKVARYKQIQHMKEKEDRNFPPDMLSVLWEAWSCRIERPVIILSGEVFVEGLFAIDSFTLRQSLNSLRMKLYLKPVNLHCRNDILVVVRV